jgi:hypothetical protein
LAAHPGAFGIFVLYAVLWVVFDRNTLDWHAVATLAVWFTTYSARGTAIRRQAKLDELLHAHSQANSALRKIDDQDIVSHRTRAHDWEDQLRTSVPDRTSRHREQGAR